MDYRKYFEHLNNTNCWKEVEEFVKDKKFISKPNQWFKENTEVKFIEYLYSSTDMEHICVFMGIYIVGSSRDAYDKFWYSKGYKDGDEVLMTESCGFDEFEIIVI